MTSSAGAKQVQMEKRISKGAVKVLRKLSLWVGYESIPIRVPHEKDYFRFRCKAELGDKQKKHSFTTWSLAYLIVEGYLYRTSIVIN